MQALLLPDFSPLLYPAVSLVQEAASPSVGSAGSVGSVDLAAGSSDLWAVNLLWATALVTGLGALFCLYLKVQVRSAVGDTVHEMRPKEPARWVHALLLLAVLIASFSLSPALRPAAWAALIGTAGILFLRPGWLDSTYGKHGVRRGWFARRLEDVEEWRLTGQHLRWKLYGQWLATDVPTSYHEELRERLRQSIPERESSFQR